MNPSSKTKLANWKQAVLNTLGFLAYIIVYKNAGYS